MVKVDGVRYEDKVCVACGMDVSSLTRTRDPRGDYYCQPCWESALRTKRAVTARQREPEFAWVTKQLSRLHFGQLWKPLAVLGTLGLLGLSWWVAEVGKIVGASLLVMGVAVLVICTVWLYVIPFRDGAAVGMACIQSKLQRRAWAQKNPEFNLRRPASLVMTGVWITLLSLAFFAIWVGKWQHLWR
jgi:hypothetical protein